LVQVAGTGAVLLLFFGMYESVSWRVPLTTGTALLCLLLVDFLYYWEHRVGHEVNLCWAMYHSVHHSAQHYDQSIGLRISFADFFVSPLFFLPLVLFGFHPLLVFACLGVVLGWQQWIHTEMVPKLLWLDRWLNTPSNHRVHHGSNPEYLDKNYGGILIVWDRLFGTYEVEKETVVYGLVEPLESHHPLDVHIHVFRKLMKKARETHSWSELARLLFRNPPF
jgi:sterol desaturase/sphingolipid hydroxylase (fatty acid hydroxylase superfamily)